MQRERLDLPDGDFVDLAWNLDHGGPLVCIFHGLQGCIRSNYASAILSRLHKDHCRLLFMHFRGCSGEPNLKPGSYHSGHTDDIRFLLKTAQSRLPDTPIYAVAYSLGANALLKYLGEESRDTPLCKAVAVSPPLVLSEGAKRMNQGFSKIYQRWLIHQLQQAIIQKQRRYPTMNLPRDVHQYASFWEFDNAVTAPLHGFENVHDYYERASSRRFLSSIETPTHIIFSKDDPFFTERVIPREDELSESVCLELSEHGGHVGYIGLGPFGSMHYWLEQRISELLL